VEDRCENHAKTKENLTEKYIGPTTKSRTRTYIRYLEYHSVCPLAPPPPSPASAGVPPEPRGGGGGGHPPTCGGGGANSDDCRKSLALCGSYGALPSTHVKGSLAYDNVPKL
jgi:hypothetical protein